MILSSIPEFIRELMKRFHLLLVGGSVRDILMDKKPKDFDLIGKNIKDVLLHLKSKGKIVVLDREREEYRIVLGNYWIDITKIRGKSIVEDLGKRDFTINSLAITKDGVILDPFNGEKDIKNGIIRAVQPKNIEEDPIRILRAFRFMATLNFKIEEDTLSTIVSNKNLLQGVAGERIHQELLSILSSKNLFNTFKTMCEYEIMDIIIPEIKGLRQTSQRYYKSQNLLFHSLQVLKYLEEELYLKTIHFEPWYLLGAFLHDVGKPLTISVDEKGNTHFIGHDKEGAKLIEKRLKRLRFSGKEIEDIKNIISLHMYPHHLAGVETLTKKAVARFLRRTGQYTDFLLLFAEADAKASPPRGGGLSGYKKLRKMIEEIREENKEKPERLITGYDLIDLGFKPSPLFKTILEDVDDEFKAGALKDKVAALEYIKRKYKQRGWNGKSNDSDAISNADSKANT